MENKVINIQLVAKVAKALGEINEQVVFVGGAVVSVYADDPAADEVRPTDDIDFTTELAGYGDWVQLNSQLLKLGFMPNTESNKICNFLFEGIEIDIMPTEDSTIGVSNSWYKPGFESVNEVMINGQKIRVLSVSYYLATKFEAFNNRGNDYRTSHDFEDIIYVIDNCLNIENEISHSNESVRKFIINELKKMLNNPNYKEIIQSQMHPSIVSGRFPIILNKLLKIVGEIDE